MSANMSVVPLYLHAGLTVFCMGLGCLRTRLGACMRTGRFLGLLPGWVPVVMLVTYRFPREYIEIGLGRGVKLKLKDDVYR